MKSRAKVISQKHIHEIPPFCDNPMSSDDMKLQQAIAEGKVEVKLNRRQRKAALRGPKRMGRVRH